MTDRVLVEALRAGEPSALTALYDRHAEGVYRYCWFLLHSTDSAQVALRDTLIAAEAHARSLANPEMLRAWLYALARAECLRRRMAAPPGVAEALAGAPRLDDPGDSDLRLMAWSAVWSLAAPDREVLELSGGHALSTQEVAAVLSLSAREAEEAYDQARDRLRNAIAAEILARKGPYDCPRRAAILAGFAGELTPGMRERLIEHFPHCLTCSPHLTRQVSAAKVFELLPRVALPAALRVRLLSCFVDPELFPYRRYVARRSEALDAAGFPIPGQRRPRKWPRALAGALAAVATVVAIGLIFDYFGTEVAGVPDVAKAAFPPPGEPPGIPLPWVSRRPEERGSVEPLSTGIHPLGVTTPPATWGIGTRTTGGPLPPVLSTITVSWPVPSRSAVSDGPTLRPGQPSVPAPRPTPPPPAPSTWPPVTPTVTPAPAPTTPPAPSEPAPTTLPPTPSEPPAATG